MPRTKRAAGDASTCSRTPICGTPSEGEALWFSDALVSYMATGAETGGGLTVAEVRAPRGAGSPRHRHLHEDEAWFVLDGELTFWLGDEERPAGAGTFVFGPRGIDHRFCVESEEAHFLLLLTPAGFEDFTRACGWPATRATLPPADLPPKDVAALHGSGAAPWARDRPGPADRQPPPPSPPHKESRHDHHLQGRPRHRRADVELPVPGLGLIPINAFVLHAAEPVLVDTGTVVRATSSWPRCAPSSIRPTCAGSG